MIFQSRTIFLETDPKPCQTSKIELSAKIVYYLVSAIFYQIAIFSRNDSPLKTMKNIFISSKMLFSFSRYLNFCNFFPSFPHFPHSKGRVEVE